jgi:hypothetical protein
MYLQWFLYAEEDICFKGIKGTRNRVSPNKIKASTSYIYPNKHEGSNSNKILSEDQTKLKSSWKIGSAR